LIFSVNTDNMIYFTTDVNHLATADQGKTFDVAGAGVGGPYSLLGALAATGTGLNGGSGSIQVLANQAPFIVGLYGGTSSSSLSLQTTTTIDGWGNSNPGSIVLVNANLLAPFAAGTPAWFQVQIYQSGYADTAAAWAANGIYGGESQLFQATPLTVPAALYNPGAPVNSTWAPGTFDPTDLTIIAGSTGSGFGGIALYANNVPEPGTFALAGMGLAALLVFRRRK
jgi:hypothetical protein